MNLADNYPRSRNKLYFFQPVENESKKCYNIAIFKWSSVQDKHIFEDRLSQQTYIDMLGEPDMVFDALFENNNTQNRDIYGVLRKNNIKYQEESNRQSYYSDAVKNSVCLPNIVEAQNCVRLLQGLFKYTTP